MPKFAREGGEVEPFVKRQSILIVGGPIFPGGQRRFKADAESCLECRQDPAQVGPGCCGSGGECFGEKLSETQKIVNNETEVQVDDTQVPESLKNAGFGCFFSDSIGGFLQNSRQNFHSGGHGWATSCILNRVQNSIGARAA